MSVKITGILSLLAASGALLGASAPSAQAQFYPPEEISIQEAFSEAITFESGDYFRNRSIGRQFEFIFGWGGIGRASFIENEIARDSAIVDILYREFAEQQIDGVPVRTQDLENPYQNSLRTGVPTPEFY